MGLSGASNVRKLMCAESDRACPGKRPDEHRAGTGSPYSMLWISKNRPSSGTPGAISGDAINRLSLES